MTAPKIFAGGVAGIETLMDAASSTSFRFNGGGIYIHGVGWARLNVAQRKTVIAANHGSEFIVELGFGAGEAHDITWVRRFYERYINIGLTPNFVVSNAFHKGNVPSISRWKSFVQDFRDAGFKNPIYPTFEYANFAKYRYTLNTNQVSRRSDFQQMIRFAKGISVDTSGRYFFAQSTSYKKWIVDAIKWTQKAGLKTVCYASPHHAGKYYKEYTIELCNYLANADAMPDIIIIGNYQPSASLEYIPVVGREWIEDTCLNVGLHLVKQYLA